MPTELTHTKKEIDGFMTMSFPTIVLLNVTTPPLLSPIFLR